MDEKINKNDVTTAQIDNLFYEKWCEKCVDSGNCEGCRIYEAIQAASKIK